MSADPITEPVSKWQDPADLLVALEEAYGEPVRAEFVEGIPILPPQPNLNHNRGAFKLATQLELAGFIAATNSGFRITGKGRRPDALVIPDFFVLHREATEMDEAYCKAHKGWYSIDLVTLVGEVTSTNHTTDSGPKYHSYAAAGVPVYVLIHRQEGKAYAFSDPVPNEDPDKAYYGDRVEVKLGHTLPLPAPYPALETAFMVAG
ncbi:Uma2 family endonuclease [Streptomyces sp. NPDC101227]|uniref:Uma2 family endonuclease n=1 Tax=Streptomyces sp. NPDC101227 TaxID=3366136 RepID=UPI0037F232A4